MVSRRIECASCNKKCSGNVLRYQDQYYHKHCFESEQKGREREDDNLTETKYEIDTATDKAHIDDTLVKPDAIKSVTNNEQRTRQSSISNKSNNFFSSSTSSLSLSKTTTTTSTTTQQQPYRLPSQMSKSNSAEAASQRNASSRLAATDYRRNPSYSQSAGADRGMPKSATFPHPSTDNQRNGFSAPDDKQQLAYQQQFTKCAACKEFIKDSEALKALDRHWHVWCFKCTQCKSLLHGEYVAKDGKPFCEKDYQKLYGVTCVYCKRYITGKVLQAGDAHHFHPSCARCSKCGDPFVPGEEMYLQGEITWHPRCGPGPDSNLDDVGLNEASTRASQVGAASNLNSSNFARIMKKFGRLAEAALLCLKLLHAY